MTQCGQLSPPNSLVQGQAGKYVYVSLSQLTNNNTLLSFAFFLWYLWLQLANNGGVAR